MRRAARLLAVCPNDAVNTEVVAVARRVSTGRRSGPVRCLARIGNAELCRLLRVQEANSSGGAPSSLDFFNIDEISAQFCLDEFSMKAENGRLHILVSRLDALGTWLVKHADGRSLQTEPTTLPSGSRLSTSGPRNASRAPRPIPGPRVGMPVRRIFDVGPGSAPTGRGASRCGSAPYQLRLRERISGRRRNRGRAQIASLP